MAEYSFLKDAGRKIPELGPSGAHTAAQSEEKGETDKPVSNTPAAARLEELLKEFELKVKNLELKVEKEKVFVSGEVADQATKERIVLCLGNTQGISKVGEAVSVRQEATEAVFYTVVKADSLESIAERVLGDKDEYISILEANAPLLERDKDIYPGMVLRIPSPGAK